MKTDIITVSSSGSQMEKALEQAEKVAAYKGLPAQSALRLRLLTEEMMGMMRSITGEKQGQFWIEDEDGVYQLHLKVKTRMTNEKRKSLLEVSSSGKNEAAKGLMGRLRDFFDRGSDEDVFQSSPMLMSGMYEHSSSPSLDWEWKMTQYQMALEEGVRHDDKKAQEAWDELEKSVVAHAADEIQVCIRGQTVEMTIVKSLS